MKFILTWELLNRRAEMDEALEKVIGDFIYTKKEPLRDVIIRLLKDKPALKECKTIAERIKSKILGQ